MDPNGPGMWGLDWACGLPLIVITVIFHAYGLSLIHKDISVRMQRAFNSAFVVGRAALSATVLHAAEVVFWAVVYRATGALQDFKPAVLYSLGAMTSYGHADIHLAARWPLLGALEALNGWILFGLTTAFMFVVFQRAWLRTDS